MAGNQYTNTRWAENNVLRKLKSLGKTAKRFAPPDFVEDDGWGIQEYKGPDHIYYDNIKYSCPDIVVYKDESLNEIVVRVEVKSFYALIDNPPFETKFRDFVCIKEYSLKQYEALQRREEIPCRIVFVIGVENGNNQYYWQTLDNFLHKMKSRREMFELYYDKKENGGWVHAHIIFGVFQICERISKPNENQVLLEKRKLKVKDFLIVAGLFVAMGAYIALMMYLTVEIFYGKNIFSDFINYKEKTEKLDITIHCCGCLTKIEILGEELVIGEKIDVPCGKCGKNNTIVVVKVK